MRRNLAVFCAVATAYAVVVTSVEPSRADQKTVNKCGKTIAKESAKMIKVFEKTFLRCYSARHKCALEGTPGEQDACLAETEVPGKVCSCEKLDVDNPLTGTGKALAKLRTKIATKCDPAQCACAMTDDLLLNFDVGNPRAKLGYRNFRNCACGTMVGDLDGDLASYQEVEDCIVLLLIKAAASQVGWDTDPRAQDEIFEIIVECAIGIDPDPCT